MNGKQTHVNTSVNLQRRNLLQGAACVGALSFAPTVFGKAISEQHNRELSGELVCSISNPVKTLVLRNHTDKTVVIEQESQGALMFDGSIVDCNTACLTKSITIPANQEVRVRFDRRQQSTLLTKADEFHRIQSRVARLGDGTRVIPFAATLHGNIATIV